MEHAEAHDWIDDLALDPHRLADLRTDFSPGAVAFRAHLEGCDTCRTDLAAWRGTHAAIVGAIQDGGALGADPATEAGALDPPSSLRVAVTMIPGRNARMSGVGQPVEEPRRAAAPDSPHRRGGRRSRVGLGALAAAAALAVAVGLGALAVDRTRQADAAREEAIALRGVTSSFVRVLSDPGHTAITLVGLDGAPAGTAAWSSTEIVVTSVFLAPPTPGSEYRCWIERDGVRTPIGVMDTDGPIAYWSGPLDRYTDIALDEGGQLGVSLEPVEGRGGNAPVVVGQLPG